MGCRARAAKSELLRVVAVAGQLVADPRGLLPGRGAYIHPDPRCMEFAERRRAFPRTLRRAGVLDASSLRAYVERAQQAGATRDTTTEGS